MELGIEDLSDVQREVFRARPKWHNIGLELGVPVDTLDAISIQFNDRPADCLRETLKEWLKGIDPKPTWSTMVDTLRSDTVGEHLLAKKLEEKYLLPGEGRLHMGGHREHPRPRVIENSRIWWMAIAFAILTILWHQGGIPVQVTLVVKPEQNESPLEVNRVTEIGEHGYTHDGVAPNNLPHLYGLFIGREEELMNITRILLYSHTSGVGMVAIYGAPAVGKSTLAIHIGYQMAMNGTAVRYINVMEAQHFFKDCSNEDTFTESAGTQAPSTAVTDRKSNVQYLWYSPSKQKDISSSAKGLIEWAKGLQNNTLLILDNCDDLLLGNKSLAREFKEMIVELHRASSVLRVLVTSRAMVAVVDGFEPYKLKELKPNFATELLQTDVPSLSTEDSEMVTELVGGIPLALQISAKLIKLNDNAPKVIISELRDNSMETLSPDILPEAQQMLYVLQLSYKYLDNVIQECGQYLSHFPRSFDREAAVNVLKMCNFSNPGYCLQRLVDRSLLEPYLYAGQTRYHFHRLIAEFFHYIQWNNSSINTVMTRFNSSFQIHYSDVIAGFSQLYSTYPNDEKIVGQFEMEIHNVQKVMETMEFQPMRAKTLIDIAKGIGSDLVLIAFTKAELLPYLKTLLFNFDKHLEEISEKVGLKDTLFTYYELISRIKTEWIRGANLDSQKCMRLCEEMFSYSVHSHRVTTIKKLLHMAGTGNDTSTVTNELYSILDKLDMVPVFSSCESLYDCPSSNWLHNFVLSNVLVLFVGLLVSVTLLWRCDPLWDSPLFMLLWNNQHNRNKLYTRLLCQTCVIIIGLLVLYAILKSMSMILFLGIYSVLLLISRCHDRWSGLAHIQLLLITVTMSVLSPDFAFDFDFWRFVILVVLSFWMYTSLTECTWKCNFVLGLILLLFHAFLFRYLGDVYLKPVQFFSPTFIISGCCFLTPALTCILYSS